MSPPSEICSCSSRRIRLESELRRFAVGVAVEAAQSVWKCVGIESGALKSREWTLRE